RAESLSNAFSYIKGIFSASLFTVPTHTSVALFALISAFVVIEWLGRENNYALERFALKTPTPLRWTFYFVLLAMVFAFGSNEQEFIYFQF
ncbi:MAG TPA: hypothetical protein VK183_10660, partial [Flavobacterium sp.]|nr:hypothetical protein [Flavobacterium sp.]